MIDLHMHTTYSDGELSVLDLIDRLNSLNIQYASITDHNSVEAHIEYLENHYDKIFKGRMITGTELQAIVGKYIIEVLVYGYNVYAFKEYVDELSHLFWQFHRNSYKELLIRAENLGLHYIEPAREIEPGYYGNMKFQDAIAACVDYNKHIISEEILTNHLLFYRHEYQNPNSIFFVDNSKSFPNLEEVINFAHACGGTVSLAHIDEYQSIEDKDKFLTELVANFAIDGIECFHPAINKENRLKYMEFARRNNLLISGGSDFHGRHFPHRQGINTEATLEDVTILEKILY